MVAVHTAIAIVVIVLLIILLQATMFLFDPCGNALEFKAFRDIGQLFAK